MDLYIPLNGCVFFYFSGLHLMILRNPAICFEWNLYAIRFAFLYLYILKNRRTIKICLNVFTALLIFRFIYLIRFFFILWIYLNLILFTQYTADEYEHNEDRIRRNSFICSELKQKPQKRYVELLYVYKRKVCIDKMSISAYWAKKNNNNEKKQSYFIFSHFFLIHFTWSVFGNKNKITFILHHKFV